MLRGWRRQTAARRLRLWLPTSGWSASSSRAPSQAPGSRVTAARIELAMPSCQSRLMMMLALPWQRRGDLGRVGAQHHADALPASSVAPAMTRWMSGWRS